MGRIGKGRTAKPGQFDTLDTLDFEAVHLQRQLACNPGRRRKLARLRARVFDATLLREHGTLAVQSAYLVGNLQILHDRKPDRASFTRSTPEAKRPAHRVLSPFSDIG
ncbi:hypothetical protein BLA6863_01432 [Burkholderia lata]|uniref:Uncharacterized protein n=1 Tax=Burkholderia lata (strain ATCC 17760 / DSM 23089 / LMG 22485 / NCIMB 9086 / R18194 / 383) TaxID=482957 RepID=A0A6P2ITN8_BURL3|nr:hypothetical protein BLA6863_01432 [Burkholderia lata]